VMQGTKKENTRGLGVKGRIRLWVLFGSCASTRDLEQLRQMLHAAVSWAAEHSVEGVREVSYLLVSSGLDRLNFLDSRFKGQAPDPILGPLEIPILVSELEEVSSLGPLALKLTEKLGVEFTRFRGRVATCESSRRDHDLFIAVGRLIAQRRVPPVRVVPAFDEAEDGDPRLGLRVEAPAIQQFTFQRRKEALRHRVVVGTADGPAGGADAHRFAALAEGEGRVLAAPIRVVNHAGGPTLGQGHVEGVEHQVGLEMGGHRPAYDPSAVDVEYDREIEEAGPRRDVGDVGDPELIRRGGREDAAHQIGGRGLDGSASGRADAATTADAHQPVGPHQAGDALLAHVQPGVAEIAPQAGRAIGGIRAGMPFTDRREHDLILLRVG
jgi:hypothetical protein